MKGYSTVFKTPELEPHYQMQYTPWAGDYLSTEVQLTNSGAPAAQGGTKQILANNLTGRSFATMNLLFTLMGNLLVTADTVKKLRHQEMLLNDKKGQRQAK